MRVLGYILLTVVCLFLAVGTFLYTAAPVELVRDQIVAAIKRETGRDLVIRGGTSFAVYPNIGVALGDVELSAPPEMGGEPFLRMASLKIAIPLLALLERKVSIDEFVLERPEINLRVDREGRQSWAFKTSGAVQSASTDEGEELSPELKDFIENSNQSQTGGVEKNGSGLAGLRLGDVRIVEGVVRYSDARDGTSETLSDVNIAVGLEALSAPLSVDGRASWKGRGVPMRAVVTSLDDVLSDRPARIKLSLTPDGLDVTFDGTLDPSEQSATGKLKFASGDVPSLATWLSGTRDAAGPLTSASLDGQLSASASRIAIKDARFKINDVSGTGVLGLRLSDRKKIEGTIRVGAVRTASFFGSSTGNRAQSGAAASPASAPTSSGWSTEPVDVSGLRAVDAGIRIAFESLAHEKIRLGAGTMAVALNGGVLRVAVDPLSIYDGGARGAVVLDARSDLPTYSAKIETQRISALPLLKAVADFDWLSGSATARIDVRGRGANQQQMMRSMNGSAALEFANGAVEGLNVAKILRGVQQGRFKDFDRVPGEKTDFSSLNGSFRIVNGVASNTDLRMVGPLVRIAGAGTINIGGRALDYRLTPKLVASLEGQGGADLSGLEIPLKIDGPWARPRVAPDLDGLLKDPARAAKSLGGLVEKARGKIKSKKVNDLLDSVLGGGGSNANGAEKPLGGLLGDFLKQQ